MTDAVTPTHHDALIAAGWSKSAGNYSKAGRAFNPDHGPVEVECVVDLALFNQADDPVQVAELQLSRMVEIAERERPRMSEQEALAAIESVGEFVAPTREPGETDEQYSLRKAGAFQVWALKRQAAMQPSSLAPDADRGPEGDAENA